MVAGKRDADEFLSLDQIEAEFRVHRATIYRHAARHGVRPYQRPGDRRSYFRRAEIEDLLKPRRKGEGR
ncbi:MAG: helix-turn-helix domain-containing protein [Chloroflexi bacterium]|nr:helix-turn-helix domain-containing protein [Chloroflexota bacterium]